MLSVSKKRPYEIVALIVTLFICINLVVPPITFVERTDRDMTLHNSKIRVITVDNCSERSDSLLNTLDSAILPTLPDGLFQSSTFLELTEKIDYKAPHLDHLIKPPVSA
jgi:hypothetical protein